MMAGRRMCSCRGIVPMKYQLHQVSFRALSSDQSFSWSTLTTCQIGSSQVRLFANDRVACLAISKPAESRQLQAERIILQDWELEWDMEFNSSKCQIQPPPPTPQTPTLPATYTLHDQTLEVVPCARYIGVYISNGIFWKPHISRITSTANISLEFLRMPI